MARLTLTPTAYRRVTLFALLALGFIVVTGGAVRLTESGLGCPQWPSCDDGSLVTVDASSYNATIESVNRTITGLVSVAVILAVLGSLARVPRRRDLTVLSLWLVGGVLLQIVLGGLTVIFHLVPPLVMAHFAASMLLVWAAVVLHHRAGEPDGPARPVVPPPLVRLGRVVAGAAAVVVITGTVVTGAGPHGGDIEADRLPFQVSDVARIHGAAVWLFLALLLAFLWRLRAAGAPGTVLRAGTVLLAVVVAQGAVGYIQYFNGVPKLLVGIHIAGATAVWAATIQLNLVLHRRTAGARAALEPDGEAAEEPAPALAATGGAA